MSQWQLRNWKEGLSNCNCLPATLLIKKYWSADKYSRSQLISDPTAYPHVCNSNFFSTPQLFTETMLTNCISALPYLDYLSRNRIWAYQVAGGDLYHETNCKRAYGLGSQCRPNECLFWVWETPGGQDFGWGRGQMARWGNARVSL